MKKIILYILVSVIVLMLGDILYEKYINISPEEKIISDAEYKLKSSMNDDSSYEFVSFEEDFIYSDSIRKLDEKFNEDEKFDTKYDYFLLKFRGKNKMGAIILDEVLVKSTEGVFIDIIDIN